MSDYEPKFKDVNTAFMLAYGATVLAIFPLTWALLTGGFGAVGNGPLLPLALAFCWLTVLTVNLKTIAISNGWVPPGFWNNSGPVDFDLFVHAWFEKQCTSYIYKDDHYKKKNLDHWFWFKICSKIEYALRRKPVSPLRVFKIRDLKIPSIGVGVSSDG